MRSTVPGSRRSVVGGYAVFDYRAVSMAEAVPALQENTLVVCMIETRAGVGGDRNLARQTEYIRRGARFITTNSEIAFIMAEASRVTGELRRALQPAAA